MKSIRQKGSSESSEPGPRHLSLQRRHLQEENRSRRERKFQKQQSRRPLRFPSFFWIPRRAEGCSCFLMAPVCFLTAGSLRVNLNLLFFSLCLYLCLIFFFFSSLFLLLFAVVVIVYLSFYLIVIIIMICQFQCHGHFCS